ncbi:putative ribonuclease H-like domain-containing protein [Tanacetum coccineum]
MVYQEEKNRTLIEAARTMLADSLLPIQFWAEAVNTACYVLNRVLVTKPQMKTPYEILRKDLLTSRNPKKVSQALADESWVEAMQEELLQFKLQEVWVLCDLPEGKRVIGTKWVFRNKRDERGLYNNKARQLHKMDVKSAFLYGNITEEVYVKQPPGFEDPAHPNKVYRVVKALYGLHQAPRAWYERLSTFLLKHGYRRGAIDKTLFIKKDRRDIMLVQVYVDDIIFGSTNLLCQDKYVKDILNKFDFRTIKPASTPIEAHKSLGKDEEGEDVDVHLYSFFGIVTKMGTTMIEESTSEDVPISCRRLVSGQCKKQTIVAISSTEAEYVAAASCCAQVRAIVFEQAVRGGRQTSGLYTIRFTSFHDCPVQRTADFQGTTEPHDAASIPKSPNDYTPTDAFQTSGGDEGLLDIYALNREVRRLKKQTLSQAKQIIKLKAKLKKLSKFVQPVVKHHALWVENQNLKKQKRRRKKHKKKVSSVKLGRNKDEGTLSEEHNVQEEDTAHPFFDDIADQDAAVTPDLERKSDETEEVNIEEKEASNVKSGETEELDLETTQSTARQGTITPRTLNFEDEADKRFEHSWPIQTQPNTNSGTDPKDKGKGILVEEPKKKKLTLQQIRALETTNDEEVARKIQAEWDAEEERKRFEELKKTKPKTTLRKPTSLAQERNQMMSFLKGQGYKNLQKLKYPQMKELYDKVQASIKDSFKDFIPMDSEKEREMLKERDAKRLLRKRKATISEEQPSKKPKLRTETIDELRNYLRVVDFEKSVHDKESLEGISMITELQVIDSPDGEYLIIHRENNHFRAFDTLWEILHVLDRQDLYHLYRVVDDYYEHIPPTGLGLMLLGDLNIIWETAESSDDDFWKDQEEWEIIRWRFHESSGVHTLEIEDGTMIHMLAERRYPLSRELMIRMLEHGMEVEDESETAITLIHLFILWTTANGDNS